MKLLVEKLKNFQICYHKNINISVKNNQNLKSILKENTEKLMTMRKKLEKLKRMADQNEIKKKFENLNESEKIFIEKTLLINNQEKNLYKILLGNFVEKNEDEVTKKENTKNAMIQILKNILEKNKIDDLTKKSDIKSGITHLVRKYKINVEEINRFDEFILTRPSEEISNNYIYSSRIRFSCDKNSNRSISKISR